MLVVEARQSSLMRVASKVPAAVTQQESRVLYDLTRDWLRKWCDFIHPMNSGQRAQM